MTSAATIDTTKPFRGIPRLIELVRYVVATSENNETDWIEWKCGLNLEKAAGRFAVAKQIIGFGNREPRRAATHAGGCAFIVLGAEPENLVGQPGLDPSKVESAIRPYVGTDGPAWLPQTVTVDDKEVVIVTVEPPEWGDPIHALRKEYRAEDGSGAKDGEVFIRRPGGTHPANSADIKMLQHRLVSRPTEGLEIVVQSIGEPIPRVDLSDDAVAAWLAAERKRLLDPVEADQQGHAEDENTVTPPLRPREQRELGAAFDAVEAVRRSLPDLTGTAALFGPAMIAEDRDPNEYQEAVDDYLDEAGNCVGLAALSRFEGVVEVPLALRVVNTGDRNLESVEIVVSFDGPVLTYEEFDADMPRAPRVWGPRKNPKFPLGVGSPVPRPAWDIRMPTYEVRGFTAKNTGSTTIEFDTFDLRPHKEYELDHVPIVVSSNLLASIAGSWSATAKNRDGRAEGSVTVPLADAVVTVSDLMVR